MRLPNGYGSVIKLQGQRRNPWAVRITKGYNDNGSAIYKYLGYFKTKSLALECLADYHKNKEFYNKATLGDVYDQWSSTRYDKVGIKTRQMYENSWNHLSKLSDVDIQDIRKIEIQKIVDSVSHKSRSLQKQIKSLAVQLFKEAEENDLVKKNYAEFVELKQSTKTSKEIFTDAEIKLMFDNLRVENIDLILILIFTGYRIGELCNLTKFNVDLENKVLRGGNKTEAGHNKVVGIHQSILPLIQNRYNTSKNYIVEKDGNKVSVDYLRKYMYYPALEEVGIKKRTPHVCRHTFASILNRYVDNKELITKMMGHTDYNLTANVYTHDQDFQFVEAINSIKLIDNSY